MKKLWATIKRLYGIVLELDAIWDILKTNRNDIQKSEKNIIELFQMKEQLTALQALDVGFKETGKIIQEEYFKEYANGNISIGKLAELLDMSIQDAQRWAMPKLKAFGLWPGRIKEGD